MKKTYLLLHLLVCISIVSFSQGNGDTKDSTKATRPKDRNMFGHGIPRGLTISTPGVTEGYVMFSVPNSASVYLINRKGEVVHEWKGNYGSFGNSAYLNNDGSIVQNAVDPDFPVFAGGGEAGMCALHRRRRADAAAVRGGLL